MSTRRGDRGTGKSPVKGVDVLDALLAHVPTPETERLLLTELGDLYSGYFQLLSDEGRLGEAFEVIEQARGRIEAQELEYDQTAVPHYATSEDVSLRQRELSLVDSDDRQNRMGILREVLNSERPGHAQNSEEKPATLKAVQSQLHHGELLVEYVLGSPHSYALAISRSAVKRYTLPAKTEIERDVSSYRDRLRKQGTDPHLGQQLYRELLGFTRGYPDSKSLIIVADGDLHLLPFSALFDEFGRYLVETKSVTMAPSGTVLNLLRARVDTAAVNRPYLGVAPWTESGDEKPWILRAVSFDSKAADLPALPESRDEVESIAAIVPRPSTVLIGPEATRRNFENLPLSRYRVLHLALHGLVDPVFPDRSALVFAPSKGDDGHLEARDIRRLHLNAELVTLSACDTAVGPVGAAGVESLDTAFIEAGANSVVSTLWELEDRSSDKFMKAFYQHLNRENKADALRDAKLDLLRTGSPPYYWASYELVGDPSGTPIRGTMTLNEARRSSLLDKIDHLVTTRFYDPGFKGHDWKSIVEKHRAEVLSAMDRSGFEAAVNNMLSELGSSGLGLISSETKITPKNSISSTFRAVETEYGNRWVFQDVHGGGPAAVAGIRPGDVLISIGDRELFPPQKPAFSMGQTHDVAVQTISGRMRLAISAPDVKHKENPCAVPDTVKSDFVDGVPVVKIPLFPGKLGIDFARELSSAFNTRLDGAARLVLDLRGNPGGGIGGLRLMSLLVPDKRPVGFSVDRATAEQGFDKTRFPKFGRIPQSKFEIPFLALRFARKKSVVLATEGLGPRGFHGRVVVLVNEHTTCASEMVALFAREEAGAKIVGTATPGRLVSHIGFKLAHGFTLALPVAEYSSWKGTRLDGTGLTPDVCIDWSYSDVRKGIDCQVQSAVSLVRRI